MEKNNTYLRAELERLSSEQLRQMLKQEASADRPDCELTGSILRILEARYQGCEAKENPAVRAACSRYRAHCEKGTKACSRRVRRWLLTAASLALIIGVLMFTLPGSAEAGKFQELIARWSESIFELLGPLYKNDNGVEYVFETDNPGLQQVYDAVVELGITDPVVPMWLPEGYELLEIKNIESRYKTGITARFMNGASEIIFTVDIYEPDMAYMYHKNEKSKGTYEVDGIIHDITKNDGKLVAVWSRDYTAFSISVDCQENVLYDILDSIYTTEAD